MRSVPVTLELLRAGHKSTARHPDWIRVAVALVNVAIVWCLARGLRRRETTVHRCPGAPIVAGAEARSS
jgi:hypothetical protein